MSLQGQTETEPNARSQAPGAQPRPEELRARIGIHVDRVMTSPGLVELSAMSDHRLKVHAGPPVRGGCRQQRFLNSRGDIDIVPAGMSDVWHEEGSSTSVILRVSPSLLRRTAEDIGTHPDRASLEWRFQIRDSQIEHLAWTLDAERAAGYPGGLLFSESLGSALAIRLLGHYSAPMSVSRGLSRPQLRRLTEYIETYLDHDLSLSRLAGVVDLSASHLKTLFKRSTGVPVHQYVIQRRVVRAKTLLLSGTQTVSQAALAAGFAHQSHMARCMRRVLGITPTSLIRRGDRL